MKRKLQWLFVILLSLSLISGGLIYINRARLIANYIPNVELLGSLKIKVGDDTTYINSKLLVTNNSFIKIDVDTIKYQITLFDKTYLKNQNFIGMKLPANGQDTIDFSLKIPYKEILKDLKRERKTNDSATYGIMVYLQYSTILGKAEMPINKKAKFQIPTPPEIDIEEIKYTKVRLKYIQAIAKIKIVNYGPITLTIKKMSYSLLVAKQGQLKGSFVKPIKIKPYGTTYVSLPIDIQLKHMLKTAFQVLMNNDNYDYKLSIGATLEPADSLNNSIPIQLTKSGKMELKK